MKGSGQITVSYFGVNQAYQLALAAQELGELDAFYCSLYDAPGKWGRIVSRLLGSDRVVSRKCKGFDAANAFEIPGPLLRERVAAGFGRSRANQWFRTARAFDRQAARFLTHSSSRILVACETCAESSFRRARSMGMKTVLDCHGVGAEFLDALTKRAAADLGLSAPAASDTSQMATRKEREVEMADHVLACSELQRDILKAQGVAAEKISVVPLWVDSELWFPPPSHKDSKGGLKVIFAGKISLQKGIPHLLKACEQLEGAIELLLVGRVQPEMESLLAKTGSRVRCLPPQTKPQLRELFWEQDVLVLPSLGDSFGFVAMEAMACGLPVIVSENCGVPVPNPSWRVPVMNSKAIAERLKYYADSKESLERDGQAAQTFAREFSPDRYRSEIKRIYSSLIERSTPISVSKFTHLAESSKDATSEGARTPILH